MISEEFNFSHLPTNPGVYRMLDQHGKVLYVGKAANIQKRVQSYFKNKNIDIKTKTLVKQICNIEVTVTNTETEALLLESNLIKSLRPKYNILMRDDKSFPFIYLNNNHDFPRLEIYRMKSRPEKGEIFGPYTSGSVAREALHLIQKIFKIRNCQDSYFNSRSRPCLQYQLKRCSAPCTGYITKEAYHQSIMDARNFLQGKSQLIIQQFEQRMQDAVKRLAFEEAAVIREQIKNLRLSQEQQSIIRAAGDADVIAIEVCPDFACVQCVTIRDGQILGRASFFPDLPASSLPDEDLWQQVFVAFVAFYYVPQPEKIPPLLITHKKLADLEVFNQMLTQLRTKDCQIQVAPRGVKAKWLDFAMVNLQVAVNNYLRSADVLAKRYQDLANFLHLVKPIKYIECFDASHTHGEGTVVSCVVFNEHGPNKKEYRRFNIKNIKGGDDYAALRQALSRRYTALSDKRQPLPDVLLIDGGAGQVAVAKEVLMNLALADKIALLGIAKGPTRKRETEYLCFPDGSKKILPLDSLSLLLLDSVRDEAHRFALKAHRQKRQSLSFASDLENITGVGKKRRQALLQRFGGLKELQQASIAEIAKTTGISINIAARIYNYLQQINKN